MAPKIIIRNFHNYIMCKYNDVIIIILKFKWRFYFSNSGSWEILQCYTCGINGTHRLCSFVKCFQSWYCTACQANRINN